MATVAAKKPGRRTRERQANTHCVITNNIQQFKTRALSL
jgi:hypothetical protein